MLEGKCKSLAWWELAKETFLEMFMNLLDFADKLIIDLSWMCSDEQAQYYTHKLRTQEPLCNVLVCSMYVWFQNDKMLQWSFIRDLQEK